MAIEGYCVKCKQKREIEGASNSPLKNGRPAVRGQCVTCGTTVLRIGATVPSETA